MVRRSRLEIVEDILLSLMDAGGSLKQTRLMYKANLSHPQMKGYLDEFFSKGFIEEITERRTRLLRITPRGREFAARLAEMRAFEESFGL